MDEEEMLKRMTRLLEQGCTMLANHHDCGAPLFRCKGEIICPVCSPEGDRSSAASATSTLEAPMNRGEDSEPGGSSAGSISLESSIKPFQQAKSNKADLIKDEEASEVVKSDREEQVRVKGFLRQVLLHRLKELAGDVENEGDLDKMHRQLDCIEGILRILGALER